MNTNMHFLWYLTYFFFEWEMLKTKFVDNIETEGTAVAQCCATNRKVGGSIPDGVIGIFHWRNPSDRTVALGATQLLTEMRTRSISA